nr:hypothetical protein [Mucilaginibacter humi]
MLKKSPEPRIVNVTSGLGSLTLHSDPSWKYYQVKGAAYGPSKTALNAYTVHLAHELKDTAFKINAVDPVIPRPILTTITGRVVLKMPPRSL